MVDMIWILLIGVVIWLVSLVSYRRGCRDGAEVGYERGCRDAQKDSDT